MTTLIQTTHQNCGGKSFTLPGIGKVKLDAGGVAEVDAEAGELLVKQASRDWRKAPDGYQYIAPEPDPEPVAKANGIHAHAAQIATQGVVVGFGLLPELKAHVQASGLAVSPEIEALLKHIETAEIAIRPGFEAISKADLASAKEGLADVVLPPKDELIKRMGFPQKDEDIEPFLAEGSLDDLKDYWVYLGGKKTQLNNLSIEAVREKILAQIANPEPVN